MFSSGPSLGGHIVSCKANPESSQYKIHICKYCKKEFKSGNSLGGHTVFCSLNSKNIESKQKISFSLKGKHKNISPEVEAIRRKKISESKNLGGYRKESGRGKHGWYKGYWGCSSWELAWVIYNIEHNIIFSQCNEFFNYYYDNKIHKYKPDFIVTDTYIEIKGFNTPQVEAKISQFTKKIKLIAVPEISKYINYAKNKYGEDFIKLYEKG